MVRALLCAVLGLGLMLCTASTEAREFELSVDARVGGDSNVFRRNTRPKRADRSESDGFWEISPRVVVLDRQDALQYRLFYRPTYTRFFDTSGVDGWEHVTDAEGAWAITPVDTVGVEGGFREQRQLRLVIDDGTVGGDPDAVATSERGRQLVRRSEANLYYIRALSPSVSMRADYAFSDYDFVPNSGDFAQQVDSRAHTVSAGPFWLVGPRTQLGTTGAFRFRENPGLESQGQATTRTWTWDVSFSISRAFSETFRVTAAAGPSFIRTEQELPDFQFVLPDPLPPITVPGTQDEDTDISFFAALTLDKEWRRGDLEVAYSRFESGSGGAATSSIVDLVTATLNHRITERWSTLVVGTWSQRDQIVAGSTLPDFRTIRIQGIASLQYRFDRNWSVQARMTYQNQIRQQSGTDTLTTEIYSGFVSVRYVFDSVAF